MGETIIEVNQNRRKFNNALNRENAVKLLVFGADEAAFFEMAKSVASEEPDLWWVIWVKDINFFTEEECERYYLPDISARALTRDNRPVKKIKKGGLLSKTKIRRAFALALLED